MLRTHCYVGVIFRFDVHRMHRMYHIFGNVANAGGADGASELVMACSEIPQFGQSFCAIKLEKLHNMVIVAECDMPGSRCW